MIRVNVADEVGISHGKDACVIIFMLMILSDFKSVPYCLKISSF